MTNDTITDFTNQPYLLHTLNNLAEQVESAVTQMSEFSLDNDQGYTQNDLEFLDRKSAYLNSGEAYSHFKGILSDKLVGISDEVLKAHTAFMDYLESEDYASILKIESDALQEFSEEVNKAQQLTPIKL